MEEQPGYHTTGRSAAVYEPNYGPKSIRAADPGGARLLRNARRQDSPPLRSCHPRPSLFLMPSRPRTSRTKRSSTTVSRHRSTMSVTEAQAYVPAAARRPTPRPAISTRRPPISTLTSSTKAMCGSSKRVAENSCATPKQRATEQNGWLGPQLSRQGEFISTNHRKCGRRLGRRDRKPCRRTGRRLRSQSGEASP